MDADGNVDVDGDGDGMLSLLPRDMLMSWQATTYDTDTCIVAMIYDVAFV